jgi:DNA-binding XRE family transcriptional regulator
MLSAYFPGISSLGSCAIANPAANGQAGVALELRELFGTSLRQCRRARRLTQAQLAEATDLSLEMIGRLERGADFAVIRHDRRPGKRSASRPR